MTSPQRPLHTGFGAATTAADVIGERRLDGRTFIVTGGYSGIGLETTRVLSAAGAQVVVPARTPDKARRALEAIDLVELAALDLLDPASIDAFARDFVASGRPLHGLIGSAGIMATPLMRDGRGFEAQFSANHLGHFQLAMRLIPALRRAGGARVVAVSSRAHRIGGVDFDDPHFERRPYDKWQAYGQSKSANALFAMGLDRRGEGKGIRAFSVHPGTILTALMRDLTDADLQGFGLTREQASGRRPHGRAVNDGGDLKSVAQGAATTVWCATSPQLDGLGGVYCEDVDIALAVPADHPAPEGVRPWANDAALAERLWTASEAMTDVGWPG